MKETTLEPEQLSTTSRRVSSPCSCKCSEPCLGLNAVAYLDDHGTPKISHCIGPYYCIACGGSINTPD